MTPIQKIMIEVQGTLMDHGIDRARANEIALMFETEFSYECAKFRKYYRQNLDTRSEKEKCKSKMTRRKGFAKPAPATSPTGTN